MKYEKLLELFALAGRSPHRERGLKHDQWSVITGAVMVAPHMARPIKRYHFSMTDRMETPEIGSTLNICISGDVRTSEIGRTSYVSDYYGMMYDGHVL